MLTTPPAGRSKIILPDLDPIATKTSLVVRESPRFTPGGFMQSLLSAVVTGKASFNQLVGDLKDRVPLAMSRQSMHERIGATSTAFLMAVLSDLTKQRFAPAAKALEGGRILRMLIEDASGQVMPKSNAEEFPAHGNHYGPTAGVKIDLAYDLLSGQVISHSLHLATEQDKTIGKDLVDLLLPGDLVLRDMGYFSIGEFKIIEVAGAWWLTRLPLNVGVVLEDDTPIESTLKRSKQDIIDLPCKVGEEKKAFRFVALRATREVAAARRRERRKKAKESGRVPCAKGLVRDGWHLMLTNLPVELADARKLATIYRARWAVEIQFRAWKQSLNLGEALKRKSGTHHIHAIVLAAMIAHQLGMKMATAMTERIGRAELSYEKLYDILGNQLVKVREFSQLALFDPDDRHIKRDKRTRKSSIESGIIALA